MRTRLLLVAAPAWGLVLLLGAVASADVAPPALEDMECQRGAVATMPEVDPDARDPLGRPAQPWPYCAPSTCESDDDCADGRVCSEDEIGFCVEVHGEGEDARRTIRRRGCEPDGTCLNVDSTCERSRRCVSADQRAPTVAEGAGDEVPMPEEIAAADDEASEEEPPEDESTAVSPPAAATSGGCGCRVSGEATTPGLWLGLLGLALWVRRRG